MAPTVLVGTDSHGSELHMFWRSRGFVGQVLMPEDLHNMDVYAHLRR